MRRRAISRPAAEVELFPFLSILACTIGTLILLIIVLTTQIFSEQNSVTIIAETESGKNLTKSPRYLECKADGVVIYPGEKFVAKADLYRPSSPFNQLLEEIKKNKDKQYLIVAIRPDGFQMFQEIRDVIEKQGIDIGYEPVEQGIKLKLEESK